MARNSTLISSEPLSSFMREQGLSFADLSRLFGISGTTISRWLSKGKMPPWVPVVLEAYERRNRRSIFLLSCPRDKASSVTSVLKALGCIPVEIKEI